MKKEELLSKIKERLNISDEVLNKINDILESDFLIGKDNKEKIISSFKGALEVGEEEATKMYEGIMDIINNGILESIKHPFKDKDDK